MEMWFDSYTENAWKEIDVRKVNDKSQKYMCMYDLALIGKIC
jgi:hypothetical protein